MATNPIRPSIEEVQGEFSRVGIRGWLWSWLHAILSAYTQARLGRYRPEIYSPTGAWDDAGISDLVNDFLVDKGIERGAIGRALLIGCDTDGVIRYLEGAFHRYAISQRQRSVASNIFHRLCEVLAGDPSLRRIGHGRREVFGVAGAGPEPVAPLAPDELAMAARYVPNDVRWVEYRTGERLSPGISNEDLLRIARAVIEGSGRLVSASQLMRLIRDRFGLTDDVTMTSTLDGLDTTTLGRLDPLEHTVAVDIATRALRRLDARQLSVLRELASSDPAPTVREIAATLDISKSLVSRIQQEIRLAFRDFRVNTSEERRQVLNAVANLLHTSP